MLWRKAYEPRLGDRRQPPTGLQAEGLYIGTVSPAGIREVNVWRRLAAEAGIPHYFVFIDVPNAESLLPPREHDRIISNVTKTEAPDLDRPDRSFAWLVLDEIVRAEVVGLPTEETWEWLTDLVAEFREKRLGLE